MSGSVTIYGASDDLIELEGDVREEFDAYGDGPRFVALSDGSLVRVTYTEDGCWECRVEHLGDGTSVSAVPHDNDKTTYTDRLTLTAPRPFKWATVATERTP